MTNDIRPQRKEMLNKGLKMDLLPELNSKSRIWYFWHKVINKEPFLRQFRLSESSSRCEDKNEPIKPFLPIFLLLGSKLLHLLGIMWAFIHHLLASHVYFNFSLRFLDFFKYCTGNFRKITFLSKLHLGHFTMNLEDTPVNLLKEDELIFHLL